MQQKRNRALHEVQLFLRENKRSSHTLPNLIDFYLDLCPGSLLKQLIRNFSGITEYEKTLFSGKDTPFGHYSVSSFLSLVHFLATSKPKEFNSNIHSSKSIKIHPAKEISVMNEKVKRVRQMSQMYDDLRDPTKWSEFKSNIVLISEVCDLELSRIDDKQRPEKATYILSRLINGIFSQDFYKSVISSVALADIGRLSSNPSTVAFLIEQITHMLEKLVSLNTTSKPEEFCGIKPQKLYTGALLLVISLTSVFESSKSHQDRPIELITRSLDSIHRNCSSLYQWVFAIMCETLRKGGFDSSDVPCVLAHIPAGLLTSELPHKQFDEAVLLIPYLTHKSFCSTALSQDTHNILGSLAQDGMLHEKYLAWLLQSVQKTGGIFDGFYQVNSHPLLVSFAMEISKKCSPFEFDSAEVIAQRIKCKILDKLNPENETECRLIKFLYDEIFRNLLLYGSGTQANEKIFAIFTEAENKLGSYTLPGAKTSLPPKKSIKDFENLGKFALQYTSNLILQFENANSDKYRPVPDEPAFNDDFVEDSSDSEYTNEENTNDILYKAHGTIPSKVSELTSFSYSIRSHIIKCLHSTLLWLPIEIDESSRDRVMSNVIEFCLKCAFSSKKGGSSSCEVNYVHQKKCRDNIINLISVAQEAHKSYLDEIMLYLQQQAVHFLREPFIDTFQALFVTRFCTLQQKLLVLLTIKLYWRASQDESLCNTELLLCMGEFFTDDAKKKSIDSLVKLYIAVSISGTDDLLSREITESLEAYAKQYQVATPSLSKLLSPYFDLRYFSEKSQREYIHKYKLNCSETMREPFSESEYSRNACRLRLLSKLCESLDLSKCSFLILQWVIYGYLTILPPGRHALSSQQSSRDLENMIAKLCFSIYVCSNTGILYSDASCTEVLSGECEGYLVQIIDTLECVLTNKSKVSGEHQQMKKIASKILAIMVSGVRTASGSVTKQTEPKDISSLISRLQKFIVDIVFRKSISSQGKTHVLQCIRNNQHFVLFFVSPKIVEHMRLLIRKNKDSESATMSKYELQCMGLAMDIMRQAACEMKKNKDSEISLPISLIQCLIEAFSPDLVCTPSFLNNAGVALFRLLTELQKADESLLEKIARLHGKAMDCIREKDIQVHANVIQQIKKLN